MARRFSEARIAAYSVTTLCFVLIFLAFMTPNWLVSDTRVYGALFVKLGLWETCFRSFVSRYDFDKVKYYAGCRWLSDDEYQNLRHELEPPFFVTVQVFFTFGFLANATGTVLVLVLHVCLNQQKERIVTATAGLLMLFSAVVCTIAVIIFGCMANTDGWIPGPDHNFLSWSFALGVIGAFLEYVAAILFYVEWRLVRKRERRHANQTYEIGQTQIKDVDF